MGPCPIMVYMPNPSIFDYTDQKRRGLMTVMVDVKFKGEIANDKKPEQVLALLAQLFKTDVAKLQHWMSGREVVIKKDIPEEQANKYLQAMAKAGAIAYLATKGPDQKSTKSTPAWDIADVGTNLLKPEEVYSPTPVSVDISQYRALDNSEIEIPQESEVVTDKIDTSFLDVKPAGKLLTDDEIKSPPPITPDISNYAVLPPGEIDNLNDEKITPNLDISHLHLEDS